MNPKAYWEYEAGTNLPRTARCAWRDAWIGELVILYGAGHMKAFIFRVGSGPEEGYDYVGRLRFGLFGGPHGLWLIIRGSRIQAASDAYAWRLNELPGLTRWALQGTIEASLH